MKFLDCTIRDGGYLNNWDFSFDFVYRLIRVLDESGFDYAEIGFWNPKQPDASKLWVHCPVELIRQLDFSSLRIRPALLVDFGTCEADDFPDELLELVGLIRIAAHKAVVPEAAELAHTLAMRGFSVTINAMGITSYSKKDLLQLGNIAAECTDFLSYFYIADSFGGLFPSETRRIFDLLRSVSDVPLGFHPHNNLELAVANTLEAISAGAAIVDSSMLGLGRGGGNLRSEIIASVLMGTGDTGLNPLPILSYADAAFDTVVRNLDIGYDLEQVITGMARCHPNYASRLMSSRRLSLNEVYRIICAIPDQQKGKFDTETVDALAEQIRNIASIADVTPIALKNCGIEEAILICPGSLPPSQEQLKTDTAIFAVNHHPQTEFPVSAVIFGSVRRLWQSGDQASSSSTIFLSTPRDHLASYPNAKTLDCTEVFTKIGPIDNSGLLALALLLEAGFKRVRIFGMSGFQSQVSEQTNLSSISSENLDHEASILLPKIRDAYTPLGRTFQIEGKTIHSDFSSSGL